MSTSRPVDSLGETVYEVLKPNQHDMAPVEGVFMNPVAVTTVDPEYPESMRKTRQDGDVLIEGVVTREGRFIDARSVNASDQAFVDSAIDAASRYTFQAATLDGKPVASLLRIEVTYRMLSGPRRR